MRQTAAIGSGSWIIYFIEIYFLMLVFFSSTATALYLITRWGGRKRKAEYPLAESILSLSNLAFSALAYVLLALSCAYFDLPQVANYDGSWCLRALSALHLDGAILPLSKPWRIVSWPYYPLWFAFMLVTIDTLFYWTHIFFHTKFLYRAVHYVHHRFVEPTALGAYSLHAVEGATTAAVTLFLPYLILPISPTPAFLFSLFNVAWVSFLHSDFDTSHWQARPALRHLNSPALHRLHHATGAKNYGLYFNLWDKGLGTHSENFKDLN